MNLLASDVMIKDVFTVTESMLLKDVMRLFNEKQITGAPVVDGEGKLIGVISETDIIRKTNSIGAWAPTNVSQLMTRPAVAVPPNEPLKNVCELMHAHSVRRIIVAEDQKIVGIITTMNILKAIADYQL